MAAESTFSWSRYMAAADPGFRGIASVTTAGLSSLSLPVTSLRWSQLRAAAILAERYSLPGPRRNPDD